MVAASRATTKVPWLVSNVAWYVVAGSMHIGGAFSNVVVRSDEPSALGHGVSPVMDAPAPGGGTSAGASPGTVVSVETGLPLRSTMAAPSALVVGGLSPAATSAS